MRFAYPWLLLLLSAVPIVAAGWVWLHRRGRESLSRLVAPSLQPKLAPTHAGSRFFLQLALTLAGLVLMIFAAARPQWGAREERVFTRGRNLVIALDVSRSMLAQDVHPDRLGRAKADLMDLVRELDGDRAALVAFRRGAVLICPLTTDYAFLMQAISGASPDSAPRGETDLGSAIRKALEALDPALDEYNAILMISDGEDLRGDALQAAREAGARNIPIFTIGIGDPGGAPIPAETGDGKVTFKGEIVKTRLMDATLSAIAEASNGRYIPLGTAGTAHTTLGSIYRRHLREIAAREQQELIETRYRERYQLFLLPALFCLLGAAALSRGRLCGSRLRPAVALLAAWLTMSLRAEPVEPEAPASTPAPAAATASAPVPPGREGARQAQALLRQGRHAEAAAAFLAAARGADPDAAETYRFNAAYAWFRADQPEQASEILRPLLFSRRYGQRAGELLGAMALARATGAAEDPAARANALEEAAGAFQRALREAPDDARGNRNFTRAVAPLPEAREQAHIARMLKEHGQTPPEQLLSRMLAEQRDLFDASRTVWTNDAPTLIREAEALARRQEEQADLWIPLKQQALQAVTNQQQQALIAQQIELARDSMRGAASALQDLLPEASHETGQAEPLVYAIWSLVAAPPGLVDEAILAQSNAISRIGLSALDTRDSQQEALRMVQLFRERFPEWAQAYIQQAQADTNLPPFTAEDQARIEKIAVHTEKLQQEILAPATLDSDRPALRQQALKNLLEIRDLLPRQAGGAQAEPQPQAQPEKPKQEPQEQPQEQQPQEQQEQPQEQQEKPREPPPDVQDMLRRAVEREREHEERKRSRMRHIPLPPSERDW